MGKDTVDGVKVASPKLLDEASRGEERRGHSARSAVMRKEHARGCRVQAKRNTPKPAGSKVLSSAE